MAIHQISILNFACLPDTGGSAQGNVLFEPVNINFGANDRYRHLVARFLNTSTKDGLAGKFLVPKNYVGTAKLVIVSSATVTTGNYVWDFEYTAIGTGESLDPSTDQEAVTTTVAAPGTARNMQVTTVNLTSANFAASDEVLFKVSRDGADAADTMAADAFLFELIFEYADV